MPSIRRISSSKIPSSVQWSYSWVVRLTSTCKTRPTDYTLQNWRYEWEWQWDDLVLGMTLILNLNMNLKFAYTLFLEFDLKWPWHCPWTLILKMTLALKLKLPQAHLKRAQLIYSQIWYGREWKWGNLVLGMTIIFNRVCVTFDLKMTLALPVNFDFEDDLSLEMTLKLPWHLNLTMNWPDLGPCQKVNAIMTRNRK